MATGVSDSQSIDVWHRHLGHPTSKSMEMLQIYGFNRHVFYNKVCDVCIRTKHSRDSFSLS